MNSEFFTLNSQDLETLIAKSNCSCHFINPNKTRIILWKEVKEDGTEVYHLRIGIQKFISYPLKDKNKALYWKFNSYHKEKEGINSELSQKEGTSELAQINPDPNNPITKYQQRIAKTAAINNHVHNSNSNSS